MNRKSVQDLEKSTVKLQPFSYNRKQQSQKDFNIKKNCFKHARSTPTIPKTSPKKKKKLYERESGSNRDLKPCRKDEIEKYLL